MTTRQTSLPAFHRASLCLLSSALTALTLFTGCSGGSGGGGSSRAPAPIVASISPTTVPAGSSAFSLAVTGSNFQSQAVVNWNSTALVTTYNSATSLSAAVPANLAAAGAIANITVSNPDGQASTSSGAATQVTVTNPAPTLTSATPTSLYAGSSDTTFTFTGTNFNTSSVAIAGAAALTTTYISSTQLTAVVPAATLAAVGTLSLSVSNPAPGGGASQAISITLKQPPAKLTSLSPASATVGSSPVTVTITGSYFTPTAVVNIGGFAAAQTTYVSSTSLQFTIPTQYFSGTGTLSIIVRDPASQNAASNALTFSVVNPVPVLNSISPTSVTAGAPNFALTLTGTNFVQSATIQVNGVQASTVSYPTATSATVIVPASAVSSVGDVSVTITNPTPGGGTSAPQTLHVISANNRIRTINLQANNLGWDSAHNLLVASSGSSITNTPNNLVTIDPLQGTIVTTQPLPSSPAGISVTDDGSYVYVTLPSTGQIERFTLPSLTPDITFALGNDANGKPYSSATVAASPGHPHTVAVSRHDGGTIPMNATGGVAVYDDGVVRPNIAVPSGFDNVYDTLVWSTDGTTLYGTNPSISVEDLQTFSVSPTGVTLISDQNGVLGEFVKHLALDTKTNRLVDGYGDAVSAATGQSAGQYQVQNTLSYEENPFALDAAQRRVFYLNGNGISPSNSQGEYIQAFNLDQFNFVNSLLVYGLSGGSTVVRWGTSGLAINGPEIYLIDGSFVAPSGISSAVGTYAAPSPTLNSVSPAAVPAGSPTTQVTLTGRDFTQASEVTWNNQTLAINSITDTQILVTFPSSMLSSAVASGISVSNGPGTGSSASLGFSVLPNLANAQIAALNIAGQDLIWDSNRNLLYVAVPVSDPTYPNTIAVIDPTKPAIQQTIPIADEPSSIALSDDGQYLYSGFYGQAIVQRYALPSFTLDLTIPTGAGFPANVVGTHGSCSFGVEVKVAPGNPQTIAVTQGNGEIEPKGCGALAIYDNASPRPGTLSYTTSGDFTRLAWGADASTLFAQSDPVFETQTLRGLTVSPSGPTVTGTLNTGALGARVHFDSASGLLFSDTGIITNPVGPAQVGKLDNGTGILLVTDDALKRVFVLKYTNGLNGSGQGAIGYTLDIFDLNTQALLNSIVIPDVLGGPTQMARWGTNGIVFVTSGSFSLTGPVGTLYILQGSAISGTP